MAGAEGRKNEVRCFYWAVQSGKCEGRKEPAQTFWLPNHGLFCFVCLLNLLGVRLIHRIIQVVSVHFYDT